MGWTVMPAPDLPPHEHPRNWQQAVAATDVLVAMGGDGTIRRLLPFLAFQPCPLAILPCGTGNDLARSLGLPLDPAQALEIARSGIQRRIDLGRINGHLFVNVASLGISANISLTLSEDWKRRFGTVAYRMAVVREMWRRPPLRLTLFAKGRRHRLRAYQVSIANGVSFGGGWRIADDAALDDHALDIVVVGPMRLVDRWRRWQDKAESSLAGMLASEHYRAPSCRIEAREALTVNLDGDPLVMTAPLRVTVLPGALTVIVPAATLAQTA
jgi:YegS/Rv2252/BmrU family lipid kinase